MVNFKDHMKREGHALFNNVVQIPFNFAGGLFCLHCLPSKVNYLSKMEKYGFLENTDPDGIPGPFRAVNEERMNSQPTIKGTFENHYYQRMLNFGRNLMMGEPEEFEGGFYALSQQFVHLISLLSAGIMYDHAIREYGSEALIPITITTGLSLIHELRFNKKLRNLEGHLD